MLGQSEALRQIRHRLEKFCYVQVTFHLSFRCAIVRIVSTQETGTK